MASKKKRNRRTGGNRALYITGRVFKWLGIILGTLILFGLLTGLFMLNQAKAYVEDVIIPQAEAAQAGLDVSAYDASQSSTMYYTDSNGQLVEMKTLYAQENRIWIPYEEMPEDLINATVAIEDKRFWEHGGVDWKRTAAAVVYMFTGRDVQGGSTITQQLIKNISQNDDVTVRRKVLEIFSALEFDKNHEKEEILELYLNYIYLGRRCNGVYTAAHKYFDKEVGDLTLAECACLISITNNPSLYDPFNHPDNNLKRASTVIKEMYKQGYISEDRELATLAEMGYYPTGEEDEDGNKLFEYHPERVTVQFVNGDVDSDTATGEIDSYYVDAVINQVRDDLMEQYGLTQEAASDKIYTGGLQIFTCFDPEIQAKVDEVYQNPENFSKFKSDTEQPLISATTIIDNATGRVVAIGDSKEKTVNRSRVNAIDALRPPGSSIKPLSVYAPALEEGLITPYSAVDDTPFKMESGSPWPKNSSRKYSGLTDIYTSVIKSLNTSAVKTLNLVTPQRSFEYMEDVFGITSLVTYLEGSNGRVYSDIDFAPLALGGLTTGVSTYEMAGAYSVFARNGVYIEPHLYTQVLDSDGNVILSYDETGTVVLSEDTCYYMNSMLTGVVTSGTGTRARISGITAAGKTGTTTNKYDLWFCGYTGYYTAAVWTGYEYSERINASYNPAVELWQKVMSRLVEGLEDIPLATTSKNVISVSYCTKSGCLATPACTLAGCAATGRYIEGDAPTQYCTIHTTVKVCKDCPIGEEDGGAYHLAGEFCPEESIIEVAVLDYFRDEVASSVEAADSNQLKSWLEEQGPCTLHTEDWLKNYELMKQQSVVTSASSYTRSVGDAPFSLGAYSVDGAGNPGGELSYASSNPNVATVDSSGTVTIVGPGTTQVTITAAATQYAPSVSLTVTVVITDSGGGEGEGGGGIGDILDDIFHGLP